MLPFAEAQGGAMVRKINQKLVGYFHLLSPVVIWTGLISSRHKYNFEKSRKQRHMGLPTSNPVVNLWLSTVITQIITAKESWSDLAAGWAPWYHCLQYQKWRLESTPSGSLGVFVITSGILEWSASGTSVVSSDFDFWSLFVMLHRGIVLREYKLWEGAVWQWSFWEYSQSWGWDFTL